MGQRKGKAKAKAKNKGGARQQQPQQQNDSEIQDEQLDPLLNQLQHLAPMDRVNAIKPWWREQPLERRAELLTVEVEALRSVAREVVEAAQSQVAEAGVGCEVDPYLTEQLQMASGLEAALAQLIQRGSWKTWHCYIDKQGFHDAELFRSHFVSDHLDPHLRDLLPTMGSKENDFEEGLRKRMSILMDRISALHHQLHRSCCDHFYAGCCAAPGTCSLCQAPLPPGLGVGAAARDGRRRSQRNQRRSQPPPYPAYCSGPSDVSSVRGGGGGGGGTQDLELEMISLMMAGLQQEHPYLSRMILGPLHEFVHKVLPESKLSSRDGALTLEDLGRLQAEDRILVCEWLTEKIDSLCAQLKPNSKELEDGDEHDDDMGDIDLWSLSEDGQRLRVNARWLLHLQQRLLSDEGPPRKSQPGEDPSSAGLVLEWVYGCIVSTAEKARDASQRCLSSAGPGLDRAWCCLKDALQQQHAWSQLLERGQSLMRELRQAEAAAEAAVRAAGLAADGDAAAAADGAECVRELCCRRRFWGSGAEEQAWLLAAAVEGVEPALGAAAATLLATAASGAERGGAADARWIGDGVMAATLRLELALSCCHAHTLICEAGLAGQALSGLGSRLHTYQPTLDGLKRLLEDCLATRTPAPASGAGGCMLGTPALPALAPAAAGRSRPAADGGSATSPYERLLQVEAMLRAAGGQHSAALHERRRALEDDLARRLLELQAMQVQQARLARAVEGLQAILPPAGEQGPCCCGGGDVPLVAPEPELRSNGHEAVVGAGVGSQAGAAEQGCGSVQPGSNGGVRHDQALCSSSSSSSGGSAGLCTAAAECSASWARGVCCSNGDGGPAPNSACSPPPGTGSGRAAWAEDSGLSDALQRRLCVIRLYFCTAVGPRLAAAAERRSGAERLGRACDEVQRVLEEGRAALSHLEMQLINVSCEDPGATVGLQLVLPMLQQRLDLEAARHRQASVQDMCQRLIEEEEAAKKQQQQQQVQEEARRQQAKTCQQQQQQQQQGKKVQQQQQQQQRQQQQNGNVRAASAKEATPQGGAVVPAGGLLAACPSSSAIDKLRQVLGKGASADEGLGLGLHRLSGSGAPCSVMDGFMVNSSSSCGVSSDVSGGVSSGSASSSCSCCNTEGSEQQAVVGTAAGLLGRVQVDAVAGCGAERKEGRTAVHDDGSSSRPTAAVAPASTPPSGDHAQQRLDAAAPCKDLAPRCAAAVDVRDTRSSACAGRQADQHPAAAAARSATSHVPATQPELRRGHASATARPSHRQDPEPQTTPGRVGSHRVAAASGASPVGKAASPPAPARAFASPLALPPPPPPPPSPHQGSSRRTSLDQGASRRGSFDKGVGACTGVSRKAVEEYGHRAAPPDSSQLQTLPQPQAQPQAQPRPQSQPQPQCQPQPRPQPQSQPQPQPQPQSQPQAQPQPQPQSQSPPQPQSQSQPQPQPQPQSHPQSQSQSQPQPQPQSQSQPQLQLQPQLQPVMTPSPAQPQKQQNHFSYFSHFSPAEPLADCSCTMGVEHAEAGRPLPLQLLVACLPPHPPTSPSMASALPSSLMAELGLTEDGSSPRSSCRAADKCSQHQQHKLVSAGGAARRGDELVQAGGGEPWQQQQQQQAQGACGNRPAHAAGCGRPGLLAPSHPSHQPSSHDAPPAHFICPLTQLIMTDPVVCSDGYLYERSAIAAWLLDNVTSPVTGQVVGDPALVSVLPVRTAILCWCKQQGWM